jgi:TrmH family RNA methyltransferase
MKTYEIESTKNEKYRLFLSLLNTKGINETALALIFGIRAIDDVMKNHLPQVQGVLATPEMDLKLFSKLSENYLLHEKIFKGLDVFGTGEPILLVRVPAIKKVEIDKNNFGSGCTLVIPFQDPNNVGAVIRSATAFGVKNIILAEGAAHPFHPRCTRAASGTIFIPQYFKVSNSELFSQKDIPCIALDKSGVNVRDFKFPKQFFLLPGVEGLGVSEEIKKYSKLISIPILKSVESLNATVATSVALYSWSVQTS